VYQAKNKMPASGFTSTVMPWPDVAGSNQLPDSAKSAFVAGVPLGSQVTFGVSRVSAIEPDRFVPSVKS
jgi:hypothetical protein